MSEITNPFVIERLMDAPADQVWKALTDIATLKQWLPFFPDFKPEIGFETRFMLGPEGHEYEHVCQVTEAEAEKKLTYSWRYRGYPGDAYVTYELVPQGSKTKVILTYRITEPFPADNPDFKPEMAAEGWNFTLDNLKKFVEA
ncbi:MAG TPA: SRPBCC domain-containing protein [Candidatus Saccharimonadales bacterium]|nr:SRPBCC domain-containing protein [Candidatus Saccharimonadales bacterium]